MMLHDCWLFLLYWLLLLYYLKDKHNTSWSYQIEKTGVLANVHQLSQVTCGCKRWPSTRAFLGLQAWLRNGNHTGWWKHRCEEFIVVHPELFISFHGIAFRYPWWSIVCCFMCFFLWNPLKAPFLWCIVVENSATRLWWKANHSTVGHTN